MSYKKEASMMVVGQTGTGKSSFLNYLMNDEIFSTGIGKGVTKSGIFQKGVFEHNNFKINVLDSWGLEINSFDEWKDEITSKIKEYNEKENIHEWLHGLFYCINAASHRIQDTEIDFIYDLSKQSENIVIILTNADAVSMDELNEMKKTIEHKLEIKAENEPNSNNTSLWGAIGGIGFNNKIKVINVCSISKTTTQGKVEPFGKDKVLDNIFNNLWDKVCFNSSYQLQKQLTTIMEQGFDELKDEIKVKDLSFSVFDVFGIKAKAERIESSMDEITESIDDLNEDLYKDFDKFENDFNDICEFCNQFNKTLEFNNRLYDLNINGILFDFDYDSVVKESQLGYLMKRLEEVDSASFFEILGTIWDGISTALTLESKIIALIDDLQDELITHSNDKIKVYFENLQKEYKDLT